MKDKRITIILASALGFILIALLCFSIFRNSSKEIMDSVFKLASDIRQEYKTKPDYRGLNTEFVKNKNFNMSDLLKEDLNKDVFIGSNSQGQIVMPGQKTFDISIGNLNKKECINLSSFKLDNSQSVSLLSMVIQNKNNDIEFDWGGENKLPISKEIAKKFCLDENNVISWRFE